MKISEICGILAFILYIGIAKTLSYEGLLLVTLFGILCIKFGEL